MPQATQSHNPAPTFPRVPATHCACCGQELTKGVGYEVPHIGAVGPVCQHKFAAFPELLAWVEGVTLPLPESQEVRRVANHLIVGLRHLGFEVQREGGALHVVRMTRKPVEVAKSWKKRQGEFVLNLQVAAGLFGEDAQQAHREAQVAA